MNEFYISKTQGIHERFGNTDAAAISIMKHLIPEREKKFEFKAVEVTKVYESIISMKTSRTRGNDEINSLFLKEIPQFAARAITHLINSIIETVIFPADLKTARVLPIYKKGKDRTSPEAYRPVSNVNCIEKVIEDLLRTQLMSYLDSEDVIPKNHHGGRPNFSTMSAKPTLTA